MLALALFSLPGCGNDSGAEDIFGDGDGDGDGGTSGGDGDGDGDGAGDGDGDGDGTGDGDGDGDGDGGVIFDVGGGDGDGDGDGGSGDGCESIDVLFIVDISASMMEEQENLAANFPDFITVLDAYVSQPDTASSYRIGVTNSSHNDDGSTMGMDGELASASLPLQGFGVQDCLDVAQPWIDGPAADVTEKFSCIAQRPVQEGLNNLSDFGHERPLMTTEIFLEKSTDGGVNSGFHQGAESMLVVVNLTDEDEDQDFTNTTPAATKAALDAFAGGEERYVAVTIAGPGPGSCDSDFGSAIEATHLKEFTDLVPNGYFGDICEGDLSQALEDALALITVSCDNFPPAG
jgi:hypothetical protein